MPPELEDQIEAGASEAVEAPAQGDAEGSGAAPEAADTRSEAEKVRDEFLKTYGEETDAPQDAGAADTPGKAEAEAAADAKVEGAEGDAERQEGAGEKFRLTDAEMKALPPKVQGRIGYLSRVAREQAAELEQATARAEEFGASHEALQQLRKFASENGLRSDDVTNGLNIMAALQRGEFQTFIDKIKPFWDMANEAIGNAIAPEIQALVDAGEITHDAAVRLTKAERAKAIAEGAAARQGEVIAAERQTTAEQKAAADRQAFAEAMKTAVKSVEMDLRSKDADYAHKHEAIVAQFKWMLEQGAVPKTPEAAQDMIRRIHKTIVVPRPAPQTSTNQRPDTSPAARHQARPKTGLEAIELAAERLGAA